MASGPSKRCASKPLIPQPTLSLSGVISRFIEIANKFSLVSCRFLLNLAPIFGVPLRKTHYNGHYDLSIEGGAMIHLGKRPWPFL